MSFVKISELPAAGSAAGTDQLETNQSGTSRRLTVAQVATNARSVATDTLVVAAGSAAAPSLTPTDDANTGLFAPAADTLALSTGGSERIRVDSQGRIGINTASPAVQLAISSVDAVLVPVGTTAQRPTGATGYFRFNTSTSSFEGHNGTAWGSVGGGATGGGSDQAFYLNSITINNSYSIPAGQNAGTFGPVTVASGAVVTVPSGSTWTIV